MNPVLILTHNCCELTKKCLDSVLAQDIKAVPFVWDNASTDGTLDFLRAEKWWHHENQDNRGVSFGWNWSLNYLFGGTCLARCEQVLVLNNDTILSPYTYRLLLDCNVPFVTGVSVESLWSIENSHPQIAQLTDGPDFSCFLIRRSAWEKIGPFDSSLVHYCGDLDYHVRAHRAGVRLLNAHLPFYHERSSTLNLASPKDRRAIELQADADRERFREKWGVSAGGSDFRDLFTPETFGCDAKYDDTRTSSQVG